MPEVLHLNPISSSRPALYRQERGRNRGFSLLELSLVLVIVAILIAGVAMLYENAAQAAKFHDLVSEITLIDNIAHQQNDFAHISAQEISGEGDVPSKWRLPDGSLVSPYGPISIQPWDSMINGVDIQVFRLAVSGLSDQACSQLLSSDFGSQEIEVQTYIAGIKPVQGVAENPANAESMCNGNHGVGADSSVGLFFR